MKYKSHILILVAVTFLSSCSTYKPIPDLKGKIVRGVVIDEESNGVIIGQMISEFDNLRNGMITDTSGIFEIQFQGNHPIIILSGFYNPINVKINPNEFNRIILNNKLEDKSWKLLQKVNKYEGKENIK